MDIITARQAYESGLTRYFTGKPCVHGHTCERMISNGSCVDCLNEKRKRSRQDIYEATKVWRLKNPEARTIEARKYRAAHPEKVKANTNRYIARNIEKVRERSRNGKRKMRVTHPEREKLAQEKYHARKREEQIELAGRAKPDTCEICNEFHLRIVFDHCHAKGHFRGWLCDRCNKVLGLLKDNAELFRALANYLERNHDGEPEHIETTS